MNDNEYTSFIPPAVIYSFFLKPNPSFTPVMTVSAENSQQLNISQIQTVGRRGGEILIIGMSKTSRLIVKQKLQG